MVNDIWRKWCFVLTSSACLLAALTVVFSLLSVSCLLTRGEGWPETCLTADTWATWWWWWWREDTWWRRWWTGGETGRDDCLGMCWSWQLSNQSWPCWIITICIIVHTSHCLTQGALRGLSLTLSSWDLFFLSLLNLRLVKSSIINSMITNNAESSDHGSEARLALDWDERLTPASAWHQVLIEATTQQHQPGSYQASSCLQSICLYCINIYLLWRHLELAKFQDTFIISFSMHVQLTIKYISTF